MKTIIENLLKRIQYLSDLNDLNLGTMKQDIFNSLYPSTYMFDETDYDGVKNKLINLMGVLKRPLSYDEVIFISRWNPEGDYAYNFSKEKEVLKAEELIRITEYVIDNAPEGMEDDYLDWWKNILSECFQNLSFSYHQSLCSYEISKHDFCSFLNGSSQVCEFVYESFLIGVKWKF